MSPLDICIFCVQSQISQIRALYNKRTIIKYATKIVAYLIYLNPIL